jgi:hypothetical protein
MCLRRVVFNYWNYNGNADSDWKTNAIETLICPIGECLLLFDLRSQSFLFLKASFENKMSMKLKHLKRLFPFVVFYLVSGKKWFLAV